MFIIKPANFGINTAKFHYASNQAIMEEVLSNLNSRFDEMFSEVAPDSDGRFDPGGMYMMGDEIFEFDLGDITISCAAQHFDYLLALVKKDMGPRGTNTKYHKIHGWTYCICISPEEFEMLKTMLESPEYKRKAGEAFGEKERRIQQAVNAGHLVRAVKDVAGNLIDVDKLAAKKAKDLN